MPSNSTASGRWPWWLAGATGLLGAVISLFAWVRLHDMEDQRLAQEFRVEADGAVFLFAAMAFC